MGWTPPRTWIAVDGRTVRELLSERDEPERSDGMPWLKKLAAEPGGDFAPPGSPRTPSPPKAGETDPMAIGDVLERLLDMHTKAAQRIHELEGAIRAHVCPTCEGSGVLRGVRGERACVDCAELRAVMPE